MLRVFLWMTASSWLERGQEQKSQAARLRRRVSFSEAIPLLGNAAALCAWRNPANQNSCFPKLVQHVTEPGYILWLPSQPGIFWLCPHTQSFMPLPRRMRWVNFSMRADTVADCLAAVKNMR